jgi:rubrerythrin
MRTKFLADLYAIIQDESEAINIYYDFLAHYESHSGEGEFIYTDVIKAIINEEKDHLNTLKKIADRTEKVIDVIAQTDIDKMINGGSFLKGEIYTLAE